MRGPGLGSRISGLGVGRRVVCRAGASGPRFQDLVSPPSHPLVGIVAQELDELARHGVSPGLEGPGSLDRFDAGSGLRVIAELDQHTVEVGDGSRGNVLGLNAARIFNIYPRKGAIQPGADADVVIWDPEATKVISAETHHQNVDFNIFEGMEVRGLARTTLSRGTVVWDDGELRAERGRGKYIDRPCFPEYWHAQKTRNRLAEPTAVEREPFEEA